jgi:hypothetical protein
MASEPEAETEPEAQIAINFRDFSFSLCVRRRRWAAGALQPTPTAEASPPPAVEVVNPPVEQTVIQAATTTSPQVIPGGNDRVQWPSDPNVKQQAESLLETMAGQVIGRANRNEEVRLYVVTQHPNEIKVGIWIGRGPDAWRRVERELPGQRLWGSGCQLKRVKSLDQAWNAWRDHRTSPMPVHIAN